MIDTLERESVVIALHSLPPPQGSRKNKNRFPFWGVALIPRPASARREEGTYRQYSTNEQPRQAGWIGGRKWEVMLARALSSTMPSEEMLRC